jgi:hypothetical protein
MYTDYSWEVALNSGLDVSLGNMWDRKGMREEFGGITRKQMTKLSTQLALQITKVAIVYKPQYNKPLSNISARVAAHWLTTAVVVGILFEA